MDVLSHAMPACDPRYRGMARCFRATVSRS
jgi:hypothetical protein